MAVELIKSTVITNSDAIPSVINTAQLARGQLMFSRGVAAVDVAASIASTYRLARVKSNDLIAGVDLSCTAITSAAGDIGLYKTAKDGGAVVSAAFFASAQSLAAALAQTNVTREAVTSWTVANMEKPLWQALGLTEDPQIEYDVAITLTAAATAAGNVALDVRVVGRN
jgi:hypothetical protein